MKDIVTYISPLIESQFPAFYHEDGPVFIQFIKAYYEWLEQTNNVLYHSRRLLEYNDIDQTVDLFITYFKEQYLKNVQFDVATNKRLFVKNALDFYRSKGSERSVDLFFKLVYARPASIRYPGDDLFKLSDNSWKIPTYIEVSETTYNSQFEGKQITGLTSGATAFVESYAIKKKINNQVDSSGNPVKISKNIHVFFLTNLRGNFKFGEKVIHTGTVDPRNAPTIVGSLNQLEVLTGASNYEVGDVVLLSSNTGMNGKALVTSVISTTGQVEFKLIEGGWGYTLTPEILIAERTMKIGNVTIANSRSPVESPFKLFESFVQPKANIQFQGLENGVFAAGDFIYNYYANGVLSGYGKVINISSISSTNTGNVYISVISGNLQSNARFYSYGNTIYANTVVYEDKTATANIIAISANDTLTIRDLQNGIVFAKGEKVFQSNSSIEWANATVENVKRSGADIILEVSHTQGTFLNSNRIFGRATGANGLLSSYTTTIGISDSSETTISSIIITANGANYSNGQVLTIESNTGYGAYARVVTDVDGKVSNVVLIRSGKGYKTVPTAFIANSATEYFFNASTIDNNFIPIPGHTLSNTQYVQYRVTASNTALSGLTNNTKYYVRTTNSTGITISTAPKGSVIELTPGLNESGHSFTAIVSNGYGAFFTAVLGKPLDIENNLFFYGKTSNTSAEVELTGTGSLASFKVTSLDDEETLLLNTDLLTSNNIYGADYMNIDIDASDNSALSGSNAYGFPGNPAANLTHGSIQSALSIETFTIGSISLIGTTNPGEDYNLDPLVTVLEPVVYGHKRNDYILHVRDVTTGFLDEENILYIYKKRFDGKNSISSSFINFANNPWQNNVILTYTVDTGNNVIGGLANNTNYYVVQSNSSGFKISSTLDGNPIILTPTASSEIGHYFENSSYSILGKIKSKLDLYTLQVTRTALFDKVDENANTFIQGESSAYKTMVVVSDNDKTFSGLNAEVSANVITANGSVKTLTVIDSGFGYDRFDIMSFQKEGDLNSTIGIAKGIVEKQGTGEGFYQNTKGFLSHDKYIHDGDFYQDYSYELVSGVPFEKYSEMLKKVLHVAGTKMFPAVEIKSDIAISVTTSKNIELRTSFNPSTNVDIIENFISIPNGNSTVFVLANTQQVRYDVDPGNTVITGLVNGGYYYIAYANSSGFKLSTTANGYNVANLHIPINNEIGHGITKVL